VKRLQAYGRKPFQTLIFGVHFDPDRLQGSDTEDRFGVVIAKDNACTNTLSHELDSSYADVKTYLSAIRKFIHTLEFRFDAYCPEVLARNEAIRCAGVDKK
jgi:hypothetical protein